MSCYKWLGGVCLEMASYVSGYLHFLSLLLQVASKASVYSLQVKFLVTKVVLYLVTDG